MTALGTSASAGGASPETDEHSLAKSAYLLWRAHLPMSVLIAFPLMFALRPLTGSVTVFAEALVGWLMDTVMKNGTPADQLPSVVELAKAAATFTASCAALGLMGSAALARFDAPPGGGVGAVVDALRKAVLHIPASAAIVAITVVAASLGGLALFSLAGAQMIAASVGAWGAYFILALLVAFGALSAFSLFATWFVLRGAIAPCIALFDEESLGVALRRSLELTAGHVMTLVVAAFQLTLFGMLATMLIGALAGALFKDALPPLLLGWGTALLVSPLALLPASLLLTHYRRLRD